MAEDMFEMLCRARRGLSVVLPDLAGPIAVLFGGTSMAEHSASQMSRTGTPAAMARWAERSPSSLSTRSRTRARP